MKKIICKNCNHELDFNKNDIIFVEEATVIYDMYFNGVDFDYKLKDIVNYDGGILRCNYCDADLDITLDDLLKYVEKLNPKIKLKKKREVNKNYVHKRCCSSKN